MCKCMTETNPDDPNGPEVVLTHSLACPDHPEHDKLESTCAEPYRCYLHKNWSAS